MTSIQEEGPAAAAPVSSSPSSQKEDSSPPNLQQRHTPSPLPSILETSNGRELAYRKNDSLSPPSSSSPSLIYIHDIAGHRKEPPAIALESYSTEKGLAFLTFDLSGHGASSEDFESCTITQWLEDIEALLNRLTSGPLLIIGNGLGAWLMFLYTMRNPERVFGLVGMATAADFTHLLWKSLDKPLKNEVKRAGLYTLKDFPSSGSCLNLSLNLILDGEKHTILDMPGLELIQSPTWLLHGDNDSLVPHSISLQLMQKLNCPVELKVIENGSHWLYRSEDITHLLQAVDSLLNPLEVAETGQEDDD